jgi:hypothetical protein
MPDLKITRQSFFRSLIVGGATVRDTRGRKKVKHLDIRLYHGPMLIPAHVAECVREDPAPHRTKDRHLVSRYVDVDGTVWIFRCQIPASRAMVGEIVQTPIGQRKRIHCWSAANPGEYRTPEDLLASRRPVAAPIMPPLLPSSTTPRWLAEVEMSEGS